MTTIAFDGKTLCVDSQVTAGDYRFGVVNKIDRLEGGGLLATAGHSSIVPAIIAWLNGGDKPEMLNGETLEALYIDSNHEAFEIDTNLRVFPACIPWTGGSGAKFAIAAIKSGKSAKQAVEIACELDVYSGLPVNQIRIGKRKQ